MSLAGAQLVLARLERVEIGAVVHDAVVLHVPAHAQAESVGVIECEGEDLLGCEPAGGVAEGGAALFAEAGERGVDAKSGGVDVHRREN